MLDYKQIGKQIKIARINAGITQEYLSEKVGVSSVHISNIERGDKLLKEKLQSQERRTEK